MRFTWGLDIWQSFFKCLWFEQNPNRMDTSWENKNKRTMSHCASSIIVSNFTPFSMGLICVEWVQKQWSAWPHYSSMTIWNVLYFEFLSCFKFLFNKNIFVNSWNKILYIIFFILNPSNNKNFALPWINIEISCLQ